MIGSGVSYQSGVWIRILGQDEDKDYDHLLNNILDLVWVLKLICVNWGLLMQCYFSAMFTPFSFLLQVQFTATLS